MSGDREPSFMLMELESVLGKIAARGGPGHWTWPLIDEVLGEGASTRFYEESLRAADSEYERIMAEMESENVNNHS